MMSPYEKKKRNLTAVAAVFFSTEVAKYLYCCCTSTTVWQQVTSRIFLLGPVLFLCCFSRERLVRVNKNSKWMTHTYTAVLTEGNMADFTRWGANPSDAKQRANEELVQILPVLVKTH